VSFIFKIGLYYLGAMHTPVDINQKPQYKNYHS